MLYDIIYDILLYMISAYVITGVLAPNSDGTFEDATMQIASYASFISSKLSLNDEVSLYHTF